LKFTNSKTLDQALEKVVIAGNKSFGGNGLTNNDHNVLKAGKGNVAGCMSESLTTFGIKKSILQEIILESIRFP
jgi:hypothetical protein